MKVKKRIYIIVGLILGGVGVDKFYGEEVGEGIVDVVFLWSGIGSVVGMIDGMIVIFT
ncbi:NINE protein, partial [Staphylococcus epidermidis]|uniref:NINE protein n=1 Tax=Staphylococcus epidermidis TaxID=1282 RepID=UPI00119EC639